jgi:anti-sigma factor RsiW
MKCQEIEDLMPDYLQGKLNSDRAVLVEEHIGQCGRCAEEVEIWKKLALLPQEQPSPSGRERFAAMLETYQQGRWEKASLAAERQKFKGFGEFLTWLRTPSMSAAWACVLLVAGFLGGRYINRETPPNPDLAQLHEELRSMRQLVALSLVQQQSPSQRLQAVDVSRRMQPDQQVLDALQYTLRHDTSVDVRLAALDALSRYGSRPDVSRGLVEALDAKQSPLVQVALIDVLVDLRDPSAVGALKRLQQAPDLDPSVRKHADWGIQKLS